MPILLHFLKIALPLFSSVWLLGAPVVGWLWGTSAIVVWTTAAVTLFIVGLLGEVGICCVPNAKTSPLLRMFIGMMTRGALVVGLVVLAFATPPSDSWPLSSVAGDKRILAFSVIPFYFALLTVEVLAAKSILASPGATPPHLETKQTPGRMVTG